MNNKLKFKIARAKLKGAQQRIEMWRRYKRARKGLGSPTTYPPQAAAKQQLM